ncbi:histidinol dehydrogenase [Desulfovibrio litoralis]|uniref:Sulfopropanediol 3-dehydrogenase n=1 Tax=Desulfovibrio litoralis DSM 11393 TaxID=1121455 RepID=A0A1M7SN02_9BACT|nr:histidinol dehydrogenase [Desulfovibrio litoralis]SHN59813.1 sulfopropanediol 3-dehydrogenase [Desulfovibrio litoralis DSM 11393]
MYFVKKALMTAEENSGDARRIVEATLKDIEQRGESAVKALAMKYDKWDQDFILSDEKKARLIASVPQSVKDDINFSYEQVSSFAKAQRNSIKEIEYTSSAGVRLGQRIIPMDVAGCYVPGGRFAHVCSAIMSVATAKMAGVKTVVAATPPRGTSIDAATCYAMDLAGADIILEMGGMQAIATMAYGLFTGKKANIIVGPGNAYVAEAKAYLCGTGKCTIDVFAGPTESGIIADDSADPMTIAIDLVSQAEHGSNSPVWLFTDSKELAEKVNRLVPQIIADMPDPEVPGAAWRDYGEILVCESREELCKVNDMYAPEHIQVIAKDLDWWIKNLHSYGSLFLGEGSTVAQGDKCSGTNHILPTKKAGYYSGGLNVHKFLKIYTYQEINTKDASEISAAASRLSRVEGMEGHARACDWRLQKFFPKQKWDFTVYQHPTYKY